MLPGTQNTAIVIVLVVLLFSIIILTVICGEYIFNFESRRLRTEEKRTQVQQLFGHWWRPHHTPIQQCNHHFTES